MKIALITSLIMALLQGNLVHGGGTARGGLEDATYQLPQCGLKFGSGILSRGVNTDLGSDTEFGEYPWHVAILANIRGNTRYICGGALLDGQHIVTAGHCVKNLYPRELAVRVGEWDATSESELYPHFDVHVSDIFLHERFYPGSLHNDIAILRLSTLIDFNQAPHVTPICLPTAPPPVGERCWVTGWGKDAFLHQGDYQAILQRVDLPMVDSKQCQQALRRTSLGNRFHLHAGWLCAGGEPGKDACSGDGGGPLVCGGSVPEDPQYLAGLVSWGVGCGEAGLPGVYTNIANYITWIKETVAIK